MNSLTAKPPAKSTRSLRGRARKPAPPERSLRLRRWVYFTSLVPILAVAWTGNLWGPALVAALLLAAGHYYSWRAAQAAKPNAYVQILIFVAIHLALGWMFLGFYMGFDLPQAQFALYVQAITAFDLRRRVNLFSSLGMGVLILYVAATLGRDYMLLAFLLVFVGLCLAMFYQLEIDEGLGAAKIAAPNPAPRRAGLGLALPFLALLLCLSTSLFVFTPHFAGRPLIPPFSINLRVHRGATAQIVNPAVPLVQVNGVREPDAKGLYYYGFDSQLDLRYRGRLSDQIVMYVRSPAWSYWRSHAYDTYDGQAWSMADATVTHTAHEAGTLGFDVPYDGQALGGDELVQSFYIVTDQPNLIFAAYRPVQLVINAEEVAIDAGDGLRVGQPLKAGFTYSVLSRQPTFSAEKLRAAAEDYPAPVTAHNLQLPQALPARVPDLARTLTAGASTPYDKAVALRDYLRTLRYDYFPPPPPPGAEAVDNFLFVDRRGVCEQFATAHVVMLRALGIPARLVAGYSAGEYNALSGYYTVRASDAHAWTEVYFPGYGWVPFDPTPGAVAAPYTASAPRWIFSGMLDTLPPLPWGQVLGAGSTFLGAALGPLVAGVALLALGWLAFYMRRRRGAAAFRYTVLAEGELQRRRILAVYRAGQRQLGRFRMPAETPQEFARGLARADWQELTALVETAAYRPAPPAPELARRAAELVRHLPSRPWRERLAAGTADRRPRARVANGAWSAALRLTPERQAELQAGLKLGERMAVVCGLAGYVLAFGLSVLFNGGSVRLPWVTLLGTLPAIALTLALGGLGVTLACVALARERWWLWVLLGGSGMALVTAAATVTGDAALISLVALFDRAQIWWHSPVELLFTSLADILFLMPISLPTGFLLGVLLFGAAGLVWSRWLEAQG